jgi:hypothetical protein
MFIEIREHWNFADFVCGPFENGDHSLAIFFLVRIFYQPSLIFMPSFVEIPLAVSDISEVEDFDIRSRFPWQRRPFWKFQDWMHLLRCGSTFLWSLVKIGSLVSENLVGQAHSNIIIYLETKFRPNQRIFLFWRPFLGQNGHHNKPHGAACLTPCKCPFPLKTVHFWIFNDFFNFYVGGHFENF